MRFEGIGRRYGPRGPWVLRQVSLELPASTLARVTGANGTGKSTLLRLAAGLESGPLVRITATGGTRPPGDLPALVTAGSPPVRC
ncbi:ATP-binding cassette domain-containing protein [Streptomyces sp. NPDC048718]|uniref:ATP-binding cassette domain-containing protein n=1 Tax=Streptomyces sp. NPDC048718 TaxID=3365587 RepID=UPI0037229AC9